MPDFFVYKAGAVGDRLRPWQARASSGANSRQKCENSGNFGVKCLKLPLNSKLYVMIFACFSFFARQKSSSTMKLALFWTFSCRQRNEMAVNWREFG